VVSRTVYDANGNVVQSFSPRAVDCALVAACEPSGTLNYVTTNHYDSLNRLIRQDLPVNTNNPTSPDATQYYIHRAYDFNGNLRFVSLATSVSDPTQVSAGAQTVNVYFDPGWIASSQVGTNTLIRYDYNGKGQQTCRRPLLACTTSDTSNGVLWSYLPNGKLASRIDQQGQPVSYVYDADSNLVSSHDASGLVSAGQTRVDTQNAYDDLDRLVRSDLKKQSDANWTFSSFAYDLNGNITDQNQNGLESSPNGALVKDGHKLHSDYDSANLLTQQIDSTLNQRVLNSFTKIGLESNREIDKSNGSGGWTPLQTTSWGYFANGKLSTLSTVNGSGTTIESHAVSYLDTNPNFANTYGVYVDGNRTQDQYSLRLGGGASSPCTTTSPCPTTYVYDPRDRLVQNNDGHGDRTSYTLDGAGNIQSQVQTTATGTTTVSNTYDPNNLNQLQQSVSGGLTLKYWYDSLGRQQCVTDAGGSQANCNPSQNTTASSDLLQDYTYDYLDRLQTYRAFSGGPSSNKTDEADYVYDALNRLVQETEQHPSFSGDQHVTQFSYLGLGGLETEEQQTSKNSGNTLFIKDFIYDVYGRRLAMTVSSSTLPGVPNGTFTYGYDVHGSVSQLVDANGNTTASYGYTPYGKSDSTLSQGENADKTNPMNPFRYSAKRGDTGSGTLDMGVRRFGPDVSHFLTPDFFYGSLANLSLSIDPLTDNRYDLAGGNPISFIEWDGHMVLHDGYGTAAAYPIAIDKPVRSIAQAPSRDCWSNPSACAGAAVAQGKELGIGILQGGEQLIGGLYHTAKLGFECLPQSMGGGRFDPIACARDIYQTDLAIAQHPGEFLGSQVDYEDFSHGRIARGIGHLLPTVALIAITKGAGIRAAGPETAVPTIAGEAPEGSAGLRLVVGGGRAQGFPGLQPRDISLNIRRAAVPHVVGDIAAAPFRSSSFGSAYFERVPYYAFTGKSAGALQEAARVLRPGGQLTIETGSDAPTGEIVGNLAMAGFRGITEEDLGFKRFTAILGGL